MLSPFSSRRLRARCLSPLLAFVCLISIWRSCAATTSRTHSQLRRLSRLALNNPLTWEHIHMSNGTGGAWYIPRDWMDDAVPQPSSILEAAQLASRASQSRPERQMPFSRIPLIIHQTAASARLDTWRPQVVPWVEQWLRHAHSPRPNESMAYFFWDNSGILDLVRSSERDLVNDFMDLFAPVERADIFRVLVCKWFGGVYADVDTEPLRHPATWIQQPDIGAWADPDTATEYGVNNSTGSGASQRPVGQIWGLEADTNPASDSYWRMGYTYPVQITQWTFASTPQHPVLLSFVQHLTEYLSKVKAAALAGSHEREADPLLRTGPVAVTQATSSWLERTVPGFRWNSVTGLKDGGKSKLVRDVLILPVTAFSPGRGWYGNMGSKPISDPDARVFHHGLGSWKHFDLLVQTGKLCRSIFGRCRNWSKVPG